MRGEAEEPQRPQTDRPAELRVLVIGYGLIGRQRAEAVAELSGARLAGTVDPVALDPSATTGSAHYTSIAEVSPELYDAAIIAVPHDQAVELASTVLGVGRPVLIEKPLGLTSGQARRLEELAAALPSPSFVGYNYRFLPAIRMLLEVARSGRLGRLRNLDLLVGHGGNAKSREGWKLNPARAGGGVLLDPGVHLFDLLLALAPGIECTDVQGTRGFWRTGIEEDVVATFRREQMLATVRVSHIRWINTFRVEVIGEDGYAIAEGRGGNYGPMALRLGRRWAWSEPGAKSQRETEDVHEFGEENLSLRDELGCVVSEWQHGRGAAQLIHPATMAEGRAVTELCERLYARLS
jgi:1,5-anhydro-D-fructose reductase (1,5-anhydro-D-mannitol-forming)